MTKLPNADETITIVKEHASTFNNGKFQGFGTSFCWWPNRLGYSEILSEKSATLFYDKKEGHKIWTTTGNLYAYENKSAFYNDIEITNNQFKTNITVSKKKGVKEPWIIATNGDTKRAIKDYGYRFGGIETVFKNQKSNGFYLESTVKADIKYFESMYTMACFSVLFLTIYGADYTKNSKCYKGVKVTTHKNINGTKTRVMSLFSIGLMLFNKAINSLKYIRIPFTLKLYDT